MTGAPPADLAAALAREIEGTVCDALESECVTRPEKNRLLAKVIRKIVPGEAGRIELHLFSQWGGPDTVVSV